LVFGEAQNNGAEEINKLLIVYIRKYIANQFTLDSAKTQLKQINDKFNIDSAFLQQFNNFPFQDGQSYTLTRRDLGIGNDQIWNILSSKSKGKFYLLSEFKNLRCNEYTSKIDEKAITYVFATTEIPLCFCKEYQNRKIGEK